MAECYFRKFLADGTQCQEPAVYATAGLGNLADGWTWCLQHSPAKEFRRILDATDRPVPPAQEADHE